MPRTLYAWQDKDTFKYYLSAFPPLMQDVLDNPEAMTQLTDAAKYRPANEFETRAALDQEVGRRALTRSGVPAVVVKWDVGSEPDGK